MKDEILARIDGILADLHQAVAELAVQLDLAIGDVHDAERELVELQAEASTELALEQSL
jgi:hypothetical protein